MYELLVLLVFPLCLIVAGISDFMSLTIPNKISLVLIAGFVCLAPFSGMSLYDVAIHLMVGVLVLGFGLVLFAKGWIGGGDVKLIAAIALWFGSENLWPFLYATILFGGGLSLLWLLLRQAAKLSFMKDGQWLQRLIKQKAVVPYGIAIGLAGLLVYPQTHWLAY